MAQPPDDLERHHTRPRDPFDPNFLPRHRWLSRKEAHLWRAGVHADQLSARQQAEENAEGSGHSHEDLSCEQLDMMFQHDLYCETVSLKYNRKDRSNRLLLSNQIKLINHKFKLNLLCAQIIFLLFLSVTYLSYIILLCYSGYYYTALGLLMFISLCVCWLEYKQPLLPQALI
ncbi:hypothetical protein OCU04_005004 [Sclerotinia nivalis]|uniref:Uncharacterized protein n=1 Tax=Sclerotinia nivalis TaxID=352851 RepID=A0A9X0AP57_9HELO|nr:hypothetical protein OCU04_005004 [Sclerotinia nivalis]